MAAVLSSAAAVGWRAAHPGVELGAVAAFGVRGGGQQGREGRGVLTATLPDATRLGYGGGLYWVGFVGFGGLLGRGVGGATARGRALVGVLAITPGTPLERQGGERGEVPARPARSKRS